MKATGQGKKQDAEAIEAKRQTLRDLPDVETAKTVDELRVIGLPL